MTEARVAQERLEIEEHPSEAELRFVEDQLDEFNMATTGLSASSASSLATPPARSAAA